jgi:hypothetical protein
MTPFMETNPVCNEDKSCLDTVAGLLRLLSTFSELGGEI